MSFLSFWKALASFLSFSKWRRLAKLTKSVHGISLSSGRSLALKLCASWHCTVHTASVSNMTRLASHLSSTKFCFWHLNGLRHSTFIRCNKYATRISFLRYLHYLAPRPLSYFAKNKPAYEVGNYAGASLVSSRSRSRTLMRRACVGG